LCIGGAVRFFGHQKMGRWLAGFPDGSTQARSTEGRQLIDRCCTREPNPSDHNSGGQEFESLGDPVVIRVCPFELRVVGRRGMRSRATGRNATRKRRATANRVLTVLKDALNHVRREGVVSSDDAWRRISPFKSVDALS